jgi:hypothetical protein
VKHRANPRFRQLADRSYALLKNNPAHPSLRFKKVGKLWSARIGLHHRAIAAEAGADLVVWFWIGSHADYDKLVGRKPANPYQPSPSQERRSSPSGRRPKAKRRKSERDR